MISNYHV